MAAPGSPSEYGGGGFVKSPANTGFGETQQSTTRRQGARDLENSTIVPHTIRQLLRATQNLPEEGFKIDGHDVTTVVVIGLILEATVESTHLNYKVDDGTGCIDARVWLSAEQPVSEQQLQLREGQYIRVTGNLRSFMDQRNIMAWQTVPITDFNELTWHAISVIHSHLQLSKGPLPSSAAPPASASSAAAAPAAAAPAKSAAGAAAAAPSGQDAALTPCQAEVLRYLTSGQAGEGVTVEDVAAQFQGVFAEKEVKEAVERLFSEGRLYSTHDEEHYTANT